MVKPGGQNHPYSHSICLVPGARPLMKPLTKHPIHVPKSLVALKVCKPASQLTTTSTGLGRGEGDWHFIIKKRKSVFTNVTAAFDFLVLPWCRAS